jgi:hypothetical protein
VSHQHGESPVETDVGVPFAGLRRNARALIGGALLLVLVFVAVPDIAPAPGGDVPIQLVRGEIIQILDPGDLDPGAPDALILVTQGIEGGPATGDELEAFLQGPSGLEARPDFDVGDAVIVQISTNPDAPFVAVNDRYRIPTLALLLGVFAVAVTIVGGWRGVRSLIALALTLGVIVRVVVPMILAGWDPAWVAIGAATAVTVATFLLTEGARRQTVAAATGTFLSLTLVAVLAIAFDALARFTPLRGSESAGFLISLGGTELDLGGLVLAAVIFGALGVLDDVTVTQAATVGELHTADPSVGRWQLAGRAMNVGRSHIAATVNTLVIASGEVMAVEIVRALVGSIGIVAAVPLTTAIAVALVGRRLPYVGDGESDGAARAPGWG